MPGRNIVKQFAPNSFYHVYNRGVNKCKIFIDDYDYATFLNILKRYLSREPEKDNYGRLGTTYFDQIELLAFCLIPNHFHLLIYVTEDAEAMSALMRKVLTCYSVYFNKRHKRVGNLFQDTYKASLLSNDAYLQHISRYIHLNPKDFLSWEFSSLPYYLGEKSAEWVRPGRILEIFKDESYLKFVKDYSGQKAIMEELKHALANQ